MKKQNSNNKFYGFTIPELLVVIIVIGILASIAYVSYGGIQTRARETSLEFDAGNTAVAMEKYIDNNFSAKAWYSGTTPTDSDLKVTPSSGNLVDVVVDGSNYCIRVYNPQTTKNSITNAYEKESTSGICNLLPDSQTPPVTFVMAWGGSSAEYGQSLVQTSDGGYAVTGYTGSYGAGGQDMFLAKYTSNGALSWNKTWGGSNSGDVGQSLVQTSDGGYAVTGYTYCFGAGQTDMFIAKYTSNGTLSWNKTWGGTSYDSGASIVQTSDGGYAVTGNTNILGAGGYDMFIAKYTSNGTLSWNKTWGGTSNDSGASIVQTSDGGYAVTGYTGSYGAGGEDIFIAKYTSDGTLSWNKTWGGTNADRGQFIIQTSDGGYAVTGYTPSYGAGSYDMFIAKYTSNGTLSWNKTWGGTSNDSGASIVQTSDGGYAVTGYTGSYGAGGYDIFLAKYTSDGTLSWNKTLGNTSNDVGYSLVQNFSGGYAVTGTFINSGSNNEMFLAKYTSDGTITNCSTSMCKSPTATVTSPTATVTSPTATVTSPTATVTSPTATTTVIVNP